MRGYRDASEVKEVVLDISRTNRNHHLVFGQIGEKIEFIDENVIENAFLSTWSEIYVEEAQNMIKSIEQYLPVAQTGE